MRDRWGGVIVLFLLTVLACSPEETVRLSPAPTAAPTTATPTASPTRTASPTLAPTTAAPSPSPTPTTNSSQTPNAACPRLTGGSTGNLVLLTALRVAHNPGFDRLVFEFSPTDQGTGGYGVPAFAIEPASSFIATSGQPIRVTGNAFFNVRFAFGTANAHTKDGKPTLASYDLLPSTPLIREVKVYEDFEATVQTAVGLDRLVCPKVLTLGSPVRVVVDFPTPP